MQSPPRSLCCFLLLLPMAGMAQFMPCLNKDSLKKIIAAAPEDTGKVLTYIWLGQQYESNIPDSAIYYYQQAGQLSNRLHYARGQVYYINNYTAILNVKGRFDESLQLHRQALAICAQNGLDQLRIKSLLNIGAVYQYKQDYKTAADHYLQYLPEFEKRADAQSLSVLYGNLCGLYRDLNQPAKALVYAHKAMDLARRNHDAYATGQGSNNLANVLKDLGQDAEAARYLDTAYRIGRQINDINMQETALINLGDLLSKTAPPEKYMAVYKTALPLADSLDDVYGKALLLQGMANGLFWQKEFAGAEKQAHTALAYAQVHEQQEIATRLLLLLSDIEIALGNLPAYARYRQAYDTANNALIGTDLLKHMQELETQYEVEKQQSRLLRQDLLLAQKNRETLQQRIWLAVAVAGMLLLLLFLFLGYRYNHKAMTALKAEQENMRLKSQLEGQLQERQRIGQEMHDDMGAGLTSMLFLSRSIQGQGQEQVTGRLRQMAESLVQKMNEIIWTLNHEEDTLDSLVAYIRLHIAETLDHAGIAYTFNVTAPLPEIPVSQEVRRNVYLVCKEAVHNIIRHAAATRVEITIATNGHLHIEIRDNGKGLPASG
ncbi:MAG TPA: tetratricopeptide repeat protein, partial [Chitinophaga sp.]